MNVKIVYMCTCAILDENLWPIWIVDRVICLCILSFNKYFLNSYFLLGFVTAVYFWDVVSFLYDSVCSVYFTSIGSNAPYLRFRSSYYTWTTLPY